MNCNYVNWKSFPKKDKIITKTKIKLYKHKGGQINLSRSPNIDMSLSEQILMHGLMAEAICSLLDNYADNSGCLKSWPDRIS